MFYYYSTDFSLIFIEKKQNINKPYLKYMFKNILRSDFLDLKINKNKKKKANENNYFCCVILYNSSGVYYLFLSFTKKKKIQLNVCTLFMKCAYIIFKI
jgi:hypothetical protein